MFEVIDPESGRTVFTTDYTQFKFPKNMSSIYLQETQTERVGTIQYVILPLNF